MGRHASADRGRRVAAWPIIVVVAVLVLAGLTVGYFVILKSSQRSAACSGSTVLTVVAAPGAVTSVRDAAAAFDATTPVARSTCVSVTVDEMAGSVAGTALAGGWKNQKTPAPGLWVVDSAPDLAALDASNPAMTAGHGNSSLATSPVVLAVRVAPAAGSVSWKSVASGTATGVVPAVPTPESNRASTYALESIVAADKSTTTVDAAAVTASIPVFGRLAGAAPNPPATTAAALTELALGHAAYTAVPVVESDLAAYNTAHPPGLIAVYPAGPTAGDSVMAVPLTADWVTEAMSDAAAAFDAFLGNATGTAIFTAHDLRTGSAPPKVAGVDLSTPVTALAGAAAPTRKLIDSTWAKAATAAAAAATTGKPAVPVPTSTLPPAATTPVRSSPISNAPPGTTTQNPPGAATTNP
jgi:hypothetical protein